MAQQIQVRRDSAADWTSAAPTLAEGEIGFETDTGKFKIGDGATAWASLDYFDPNAGVSDGDKGDVTVSSSGTVWTIDNGAVTAAKVAADVATQAELDAVAAAAQPLASVLTNTTASFTTADETKLDGIEALADVTDATNVDAAGAVMNSDTSTSAMSFVVDEDTMSSNSATKVPTQQSVKAYVDASTSVTVVRKTATESVTSSYTVQDDDHLLYAVAANKVYIVEAELIVDGSTAGDFRMKWTAPAGATFTWSLLGQPASTAGAAYTTANNANSSLATSVDCGVLGAGSPILVPVRGVLVTAGTAGTLQFQWAQAASDATPTRVFTGSYMKIIPAT